MTSHAIAGWPTFLIFAFATLCAHSQTTGFKTESGNIYGMCFTPDGHSIAIADHNIIKVFSSKSQTLEREFKGGHTNQILAIDISSDSSMLISGGKDSTIVIWNFGTATIIKSLHIQKGIITSLALSHDSRYLISGGTDNSVFVYDLEADKLVNKFSNHSDDVSAVKFSPVSNIAVSCGADGMIYFYSIDKATPIAALGDHKDWVRDISFSSDGSKFVSCGDDSRAILWNVSDPNSIKNGGYKRIEGGWIVSVNFGEKNDPFAMGTTNGHLWIQISPGKYHTRIGIGINKVLLQPGLGEHLSMAVATRGNGVILVSSKDMKYKNK